GGPKSNNGRDWALRRASRRAVNGPARYGQRQRPGGREVCRPVGRWGRAEVLPIGSSFIAYSKFSRQNPNKNILSIAFSDGGTGVSLFLPGGAGRLSTTGAMVNCKP